MAYYLLHDTRELLGDKAYDSNAIRTLLTSKGLMPTIPAGGHRTVSRPHDRQSYRARHLRENVFADLKSCRDIATRTRYGKQADTFTGMLHLAAWVVSARATRRGPSPCHAG